MLKMSTMMNNEQAECNNCEIKLTDVDLSAANNKRKNHNDINRQLKSNNDAERPIQSTFNISKFRKYDVPLDAKKEMVKSDCQRQAGCQDQVPLSKVMNSGCKAVDNLNTLKQEQAYIQMSRCDPLLNEACVLKRSSILVNKADTASTSTADVNHTDGAKHNQGSDRTKLEVTSNDGCSKAAIEKRVTVLEKHKLKSIQDHYLLNKPISLPEASKLICSNRVDLNFKNELTSRVQHRQVIGVGSAKPPAIACNKEHDTKCQPLIKNSLGKTVHIIQPAKGQEANHPGPTKPPQSFTGFSPVIHVSKLAGTDNTHVVKIAPAYKKLNPAVSVHNNNLTSSSFSKPSVNVTKSESQKQMFYIITNGSDYKTSPQQRQSEVSIHKNAGTSNTINLSIDKTIAKSEEKTNQAVSPIPRSYAMNGFVVASPKPITQDIYKKLQTNLNIVKSLKAPVSKLTNGNTSQSQFTNIIKPSTTTLANENNNRDQTKDKLSYNSKLTVAQLLKYKRSEEQLEVLLKSKLNTSSNASTEGTSQMKEQTNNESKNGICSQLAGSENKTVTSPKKLTVSPDHSYPSIQNISTMKDRPSTSTEPKQDSSRSQSYNIVTTNTHKHDEHASSSTADVVDGTKTPKDDIEQQGHRHSSFSVKVGDKMVVMRKHVTSTSPDNNPISRKKLPAPKSKKQREIPVKCGAMESLKKKLGKKTSTPKDVLVKKLMLMRKSKLIKKLKTVKPKSVQHHYSPTMLRRSDIEPYNVHEVSTSSTEDDLHKPTDTKCDRDSLATVLQIWKAGDGTFQHNISTSKLENVSHDKNMFRRWHEYSDYPCVIHFSENGTVSQIDIENIKPGFYLLTRTDNSQTDGIPKHAHTLTAILSIYPADLCLLPNSSRAIAIGSFINKATVFHNERVDHPDDNLLIDLIRKLRSENGEVHVKPSSRYASVTDVNMSPRIVAPIFYSRNMKEYFSDLSTEETSKASNPDKEKRREKQTIKTKSLSRLPSCSSKAAALKKKQNKLLKTCQKITNARRLNCTNNNKKSTDLQSEGVCEDEIEMIVVDEEAHTSNDLINQNLETINSKLKSNTDTILANELCVVNLSTDTMNTESSEEDLSV